MLSFDVPTWERVCNLPLEGEKKEENHALSVHDITNKEFQLIKRRHGGLSHSMTLSIRSGNYFGVCDSL